MNNILLNINTKHPEPPGFERGLRAYIKRVTSLNHRYRKAVRMSIYPVWSFENDLRNRGYRGAQIVAAWENASYRVISFLCTQCWQCEANHGSRPLNASVFKNQNQTIKVWCPKRSTGGHYLSLSVEADYAWHAIKERDIELPIMHEEIFNEKKIKKTSHPKKVLAKKKKVVMDIKE